MTLQTSVSPHLPMEMSLHSPSMQHQWSRRTMNCQPVIQARRETLGSRTTPGAVLPWKIDPGLMFHPLRQWRQTSGQIFGPIGHSLRLSPPIVHRPCMQVLPGMHIRRPREHHRQQQECHHSFREVAVSQTSPNRRSFGFCRDKHSHNPFAQTRQAQQFDDRTRACSAMTCPLVSEFPEVFGEHLLHPSPRLQPKPSLSIERWEQSD